MKSPQFMRASAAAIQSQVRRIARSIVNGDEIRGDHLQQIRQVAAGNLVVVPAADAERIAALPSRLERWHALLAAGDARTVQRELSEMTGRPPRPTSVGGPTRE